MDNRAGVMSEGEGEPGELLRKRRSGGSTECSCVFIRVRCEHGYTLHDL